MAGDLDYRIKSDQGNGVPCEAPDSKAAGNASESRKVLGFNASPIEKERVSPPMTSREKKITGEGVIPLWSSKRRWFLIIGDLLLISLAGFFSPWIRFGHPVDVMDVYMWAFTSTMVLYPCAIYIFDLYNTAKSFKPREALLRSAMAILIGGLAAGLLFYLLPEGKYGRGILVIHMVLAWMLIAGWRWVFARLFQAAIPRIPTLILGAGNSGRIIYHLLDNCFSPYDVKGFLDDDPAKRGRIIGSPAVIGTIDQLEQTAAHTGAKAAVVAIGRDRSSALLRNILLARLRGIVVYDMPDVYESLTGRIPVGHVEDQWLLFAKGFYLLSKEYVRKVKRLLDISLSGFLLLWTAPLMALTALAIRIDSRGPVFYMQERVGKNGRLFTIYKFRSMSQNAEEQGAAWAAEEDPRITRVGRWLRLLHIDELPQLWNVFKGEISLVGPRPERPEFVKELEAKIPYYFVRHSVEPGITGWAQVNYRYGSSVEDASHKLEYDLYYIKNMSILLDIKILLRTIGVVLLGEGAR